MTTSTSCYNSDRGGAGYELNLVDNRLQFNLQHITPYNMISVGSVDPLAQGQVGACDGHL